MPSIQRFTQRARRALALAQETAERMEHSAIETGHLLVGLALEEGGVAARALRDLGAEPPQLEAQMGKLYRGERRHPFARLDLSAGVKQALENAVAEARQMGHDYIGTEHLLIALTRRCDGQVKSLLEGANLTCEQVHEKALAILREIPPAQMIHESPVEAARDLLTPLLHEMEAGQREMLVQLFKRLNSALDAWEAAGAAKLTQHERREAIARALAEFLSAGDA